MALAGFIKSTRAPMRSQAEPELGGKAVKDCIHTALLRARKKVSVAVLLVSWWPFHMVMVSLTPFPMRDQLMAKSLRILWRRTSLLSFRSLAATQQFSCRTATLRKIQQLQERRLKIRDIGYSTSRRDHRIWIQLKMSSILRARIFVSKEGPYSRRVTRSLWGGVDRHCCSFQQMSLTAPSARSQSGCKQLCKVAASARSTDMTSWWSTQLLLTLRRWMLCFNTLWAQCQRVCWNWCDVAAST